MVLVYGLALIAISDGFGQPLTDGFAFSQIRRVAHAAACGTLDRVQGEPLGERAPWINKGDPEPRYRDVFFGAYSAYIRTADSRIQFLSGSDSQATQVWRSDRVISEEQVKLVLEKVVPECGFELKVADLWTRPSSSGIGRTWDVNFRPVWGGIPFDYSSSWLAALDCETGRVIRLHAGGIPRPPSSTDVATTAQDASPVMIAEVFRRGVEDFECLQPAKLVVTVADNNDLPPTQFEYDMMAWEKCPQGVLMYEGLYADKSTWDAHLKSYKRQFWIFVDAKTGKLARVEAEP